MKFQGETLSIPRAFSLRHVIRLILMCLTLIVIYWVTWFFQIRNIPAFRDVQILTFFWNQNVPSTIDSQSDSGVVKQRIGGRFLDKEHNGFVHVDHF